MTIYLSIFVEAIKQLDGYLFNELVGYTHSKPREPAGTESKM